MTTNISILNATISQLEKTYSYMTVHLYNTYLNCTGWISVEYNPCQRSNLGTGSKIYIQYVLINVNT